MQRLYIICSAIRSQGRINLGMVADERTPAQTNSRSHVGYKVAAQMGDRYYDALKTLEADVTRSVTEIFWERHIKPLFMV